MHRVIQVVCLLALTACHPGTPPSPSSPTATGGKSVACYVADQFVCHEYPAADEKKANEVAVACSSTSGTPSGPANCPSVGYKGKCMSDEAGTPKVERFYVGADVAYSEDFCVKTTHGNWSTTF